MKRKKGAQPGNRNAFIHGFYCSALTPEEKQKLKLADSLNGLDAEIALLRLKIIQLLERDPENIPLILRASATLGRLVRVKSSSTPQVNDLKQAFDKVWREVALPLGIKIDEKSSG